MSHKARSLALVALAGLGTASCDPCATTLGCSGPATVAVVGQIVDDATGYAMPNVHVDLAWQSGVGLATPTASATTRSDGTFHIEVPASENSGDVFVTLTVSGPGRRPYSIPDVRLHAATRTGDATVLPPWVGEDPIIPYMLVMRPDRDIEVGLANATVVFRRTSGPRMQSRGIPVPEVTGKTDANGLIHIFNDVRAETGGIIVGDIIVRSPTTSDSLVIPQVPLIVSPRYEPPIGQAIYSTGSL